MADVSNRDDVKRMCDTTVDRFGTIDILINYAGIPKDALWGKMTLVSTKVILPQRLHIFNEIPRINFV